MSAGVAALAVAAGLTGPAMAQSAPSGLGTSLSSTKVLTAQLGQNGSLLDLALLTDEARATLDSAVATPGSFSRLSLGKVSSSIVPTEAVNKTLPSFEAKDTGPTSADVSAGALALAEPVLKGSVNAGKLTATLTDGVAAAGLNAEVTNVTDALGGLLKIASAKSGLEAKAASDASNAGRSVSVSDVSALNLGALLTGLGIDLGSLSVAQIAALVDGLVAQTGLPLPSGQTTLTGAITQINAAIDQVQASVTTVDGTVTAVTTPVTDTLNTTIGSLLGTTAPTLPTTTIVDPTATALIEAAQAIIDDLQAQLKALVEQGVKALDNLALLRLEGVEVGVKTKAVQDVKASTAEVVGKIGKISVGNSTIANGLDLVAATDQVTKAVTDLNGKLSSVLGMVHPDLANLVKVSVLDKATDVAVKDGYSTATAGVTALSATITPPASLAAVLAAVNALAADVVEVADVLGVTVAQVPAALGLNTGMNSLASTLSLGFGALSQPANVKVAQVLSASNYRVGTATTTGAPGGSSPTLPRTGGDTLLLTVAAAVIIGLIGRRILLAPEAKPVRVRK
ncbi:MAG TPA: hypothetical protein VM345_01080 [Acidimicrobiales bacterium]|nr:hypothetical protein [Acidimicrobiales bacterium]